ncbi:DNA-directed 5'-3' RNA polymerase [Aureococcus anophagefferens]|nr:DNA-directed 5'-3' RNA polymerase [Aureococcus anophagefferens]
MGTRTAARQPREPFDGIDVGSYSTPRFVDLDGDGDLDLVVGEQDGTLNYYENVGSATLPSYEARTGNENPFDDIDIWNGYSAPALGDVDGDGDLDLVVGALDGALYYFENVGSATSPTFATVAGAASPSTGSASVTSARPRSPTSTATATSTSSWANGTASSTTTRTSGPRRRRAAAVTGSTSPFDGIDVDSSSRPAFVDLDGDGDLDLVVGERDGVLYYYENVGSASLPTFAAVTGSEPSRHHGIEVDDYPAPAFVDGDGDGDLDLVLGNNDGTLDYYENILEPPARRRPGAVEDASARAGAVADDRGAVEAASAHAVAPAPSFRALYYYENVGSAATPSYVAVTGSANPFDGIDVGLYSAPALADVDGDGDLDLVVGEMYGTLCYFENVGSATSPSYAARTGSANPFDGIDVGSNSAPALADVDGDGDLDLVVGEMYGALYYYENVGSATSPSYAARTGSANPFDGIDVGSDSKPELVDLDGDGDLDLVVGTYVGALYYYENVGSAASPSYAAVTPISSSFDIIDVGSWSAPALVDVDGDGDLDLVVGEYDGVLNYCENIRNRRCRDLAADTVFNDLYACVVAAGVDPGSFDDDGAAADDGAAGGLPTCASMQAEVDVGCGQGVQFGPCASEFEAYYVCSMDYMALTYLGEDCGFACPSSPPPPSPRPTAAPMAPTYEVAGTMAFAGVSVEDAAAHEDVFVAAIAGVAGVPPEDVSITSFAAAARRRLDECEPCDGDAGCGNLYTADDCANAAEVLGDPGKVCAWTPCDEEGGGDTAAVSVASRSGPRRRTAQLCVDALAAATGDDVDTAVVAAAAAASAADVFERDDDRKDVAQDL